MDINKYDESGLTPLMKAVIEGDLDEVRRLLALGADTNKADETWGTTKAVDFARRFANKSEIHHNIYELLNSKGASGEARDLVDPETSELKESIKTTQERKIAWPYEKIETFTGRHVIRIRSSIFCFAGVSSFLLGIMLLSQGGPGGGILILFLAPCLLLYPVVRSLFGGKDSAAAAVTTVVVEEMLKQKIKNTVNKKKKRK